MVIRVVEFSSGGFIRNKDPLDFSTISNEKIRKALFFQKLRNDFFTDKFLLAFDDWISEDEIDGFSRNLFCRQTRGEEELTTDHWQKETRLKI
jgi:hypothetical protein